MAWTFNSNRIYTSKSDEGTSQIMPRLQPLSGGSVLQSYGYDSTIRNMTALIVGDTIKNNLIALSQDGGLAHALVSPEGSLGNWILKDIKISRTPSICQTIDTLQAEDSPVYECEFTFWQEN